MRSHRILVGCLAALGVLIGCHALEPPPARPSRSEVLPISPRAVRQGDEIVVCGQIVHTGAPVVLWSDPGGCNAYRDPQGRPLPMGTGFDERRPMADQPRRLSPQADLAALRQVVDQIVLHYDGSGTSARCFATLQQRRLSAHFLLDLDGTIYQTLDLRERAFHATISNDRSIGIEIANMGAVPPGQSEALARWYHRDSSGHTRIDVPPPTAVMALPAQPSWRPPGFVPRPYRDRPVTGVIQGQLLRQYDLTPQQYESLIKLTAALCRTFPQIRCDYPRDATGQLIPHQLAAGQLARHRGLLGHYHVQANKIDPGPALQWDLIVSQAGRLLDTTSR